jgi:PAT family beta-lactamase induction signal transducer AmpG
MLVAFALGFSSGLPYAALESTLQAWLTEAKLDIKTIAQFSWVLMPFCLKFLWAPFLDQIAPPLLGRRRGWAIVSQFGLVTCFGLMACCDPSNQTLLLGAAATLAAFFSASQDIALDAQRRELFSDEELGLASTFFVNGYRVGLIASGALALILATHLPWWQVYLLMSLATTVCMVAVLLSDEPEPVQRGTSAFSMSDTLAPFAEFFTRRGWIVLLSFIVLYKLGDSMAAALRTKFLLDMMYTKLEIAEISKAVGLAASICGAFAGGILMLRLKLMRSLWVFGILQAVSTIGFWWIAESSPDRVLLAVVIALENFTGGMGTTAHVAFIGSICDRRFSGSQYAGLTSIIKIPAIVASACSGDIVAAVGWSSFFVICVAAALPAFGFLPFLSISTSTPTRDPDLTIS